MNGFLLSPGAFQDISQKIKWYNILYAQFYLQLLLLFDISDIDQDSEESDRMTFELYDQQMRG